MPAKPDLSIEWWPIDRPQPYERNARKIPESAIAKVAASIREYGWRQPIVCDPKDVIIMGHVRLLAAQKLDLKIVPVHVAHLSAAKVRALRLADNRTHDEASWDRTLLSLELADLASLGVDLADTGFNAAELTRLLPPDADEPARVEQADKLLRKWKVNPGQLWEIGPHRLLCGDTTKPADVATLMGGRRAGVLLADPPYGVGYTGGRNREREAFRNDPTDQEAYEHFVAGFLTAWAPSVDEKAALYLFYADRQMSAIARAVDATGWQRRCVIVWRKQHFIFSRAVQHYHQQHEPCLYASRNGLPAWYGTDGETTMWEIDRPMKSASHPTEKPAALYTRMIANSTAKGDLVAECFLGSGTAMVAAHQLGRGCYGIEIEPKYCAVILERMKKLDIEGKPCEAASARRESA